MRPDLTRKLLSAMYRMGVQDHIGIPPNDPALARIADDLGVVLDDDSDDQTRMNKEANDWHD